MARPVNRVVCIDLEVPARDVATLNGSRGHHMVHAKKVAPLRDLGHHVVRASPHRGVTLAAADLEVALGWPTRVRRDAHNVIPTLKALIDGMVDAGLLPDDDDRHLTGPDLRPYYAGDKGLVLMRFVYTEREPTPRS